jgi:uncharacterized membrane protein YdjX (TVP38/TMEM64 family)
MSDVAESNIRGGRGKLYLLLGIAVLLLASPFFLPVKAWFLQALELLRGFGVWGLVGLTVAYVAACILMLPGSILTLGAGFIGAALWPESLAMALLGGGVAASIGSTLGATAAFLLGRTVLRARAARAIAGNPRFRALDEAIGRNGFKMVFLVRLSPAFPFNVLNYALGLTKVRLRDYFFASWMGMFPGMLLYVYLGATAQSLAAATGGAREKTPQEYAVLIVGLIATLLVVVVVTRMARRALNESVAAQANGQE